MEDVLPERLKPQPTILGPADVAPGVGGPVFPDQLGAAGRFGQQLALAAALHVDEPEGSCIHAFSHAEQAVVLVDGGLPLQELRSEGPAG